MTSRPRKVKEAFSPPVPSTISASLFKATCLELMDDLAARHAEIVVTKHGRPVVIVGPVNAVTPSLIGFMRGLLVEHGDIVAPDPEAWTESSSDPLNPRKRS